MFSGFMCLLWLILGAMNSQLPNHAGKQEAES